MSEFYPTTTCTFYTTFVPRNSYDKPDSDNNETIAATGVPIQILTQRITQFVPAEFRTTTVKTYAARVRGHHHIEFTYRIKDERTGERYMIDEMDMAQNPTGDDSWYLVLRKVPKTPGQ